METVISSLKIIIKYIVFILKAMSEVEMLQPHQCKAV